MNDVESEFTLGPDITEQEVIREISNLKDSKSSGVLDLNGKFLKQCLLHSSLLNLNFNDNKFMPCIFIDMAKAFNSIACQLLLNKLERYGFRMVAETFDKLLSE